MTYTWQLAVFIIILAGSVIPALIFDRNYSKWRQQNIELRKEYLKLEKQYMCLLFLVSFCF